MLVSRGHSLLFLLQPNFISEAQEGDPKYMAPELMQGVFTKAADVFRFDDYNQ